MSDSDSQNQPEPKTQVEPSRGGSGGKKKTAVGSGSGGRFDGTEPSRVWPEQPNFGQRHNAVICEKHDLLRAGLKKMISGMLNVVGEAANGMTGAELISRLKPKLLIADIDLDILNGLDLCRRLSKELPHAKAIIYTDLYSASMYYHQLIRAGANVICLKSSGPVILFEAIKSAINSQPYCDSKILELIEQRPSQNQSELQALTNREFEILLRLDMRNREISEELDLNVGEVEDCVNSILAKLKTRTRTSAALKAVQLGFQLLPKLPTRSLESGITDEQAVAMKFAEEALRLDFH